MNGASLALCEGDCRIRGRHTPHCADEECRGCLCRTAADGVLLCELHVERLAEDALEAPSLHYDLGLVLVRKSGNAERTSGSAIAAPMPNEDAMQARIAIRSTLVRLTRLIVTQRGVCAPQVRRGGLTYLDSSTAALGPFVARHALWLAGHARAGEHSRALHAATRGKVRGMAYPSGTDRLYIGDCPVLIDDRDGTETVCGSRLYQRPDQPLVTCLGCGASETIEQWQRWLVGEAVGMADAEAIAAHLAMLWMRPVESRLIRVWAHRGHVHPFTRADVDKPEQMNIVHDERGRTMYPVQAVVAYARQRWGAPYSEMHNNRACPT